MGISEVRFLVLSVHSPAGGGSGARALQLAFAREKPEAICLRAWVNSDPIMLDNSVARRIEVLRVTETFEPRRRCDD